MKTTSCYARMAKSTNQLLCQSVATSTVPSPRGVLVGLIPKQNSNPPKLKYETIKKVEFLSNIRMSSSPAQHKCKAPNWGISGDGSGQIYFLGLLKSRGDNRLWLRFGKYITIFTLHVHWVGQTYQVCLEDMCNFPQFTILCLSHVWLIF